MNQAALDWEHQRTFLAVLRQGSLSAAARALQIAQPTVRRRIEALETSMRAALFTRSPLGLVPTAAGRALGPHAEAMAKAAEAFERASSARSRALAGRVRITASEVVGTEVLPAMLQPLRERHSELQLELALSNRTEDLLRQEADLAVRMLRPKQDALVVKRVGGVALGLFASRGYVERHGRPRSLDELGAFALIGPDKQLADLHALQRAGLPLESEALAVRIDSHVAQLAAIRAGLGIGVCQRALARREPMLVPILAEVFQPRMDTWLAMHEDLRKLRHVRVVFDHLHEQLSAYAKLA